MTAAEKTVVIDPSGTAVAAYNPADMAKPLVDATQTVYEKIAGGFEWYFEHWVDLFEEIKAEQAVGLPNLEVAAVMAALSDAKVASSIPGRVRLRLPELKKQADLCAQLAEAIEGVSGIDAVHVSPITGSILALYDADEYRSLDELLQAIVA